MDASFLSSVAWSAVSKWSAQAVVWASTIVVARLLTPKDFGLMGMATLFMGAVTLLTEMGVGLSVVVLRDLTLQQLSQLNTVALLMGVLGFGLSLAAAHPLAQFFATPEVAGIVQVLGLTFVLGGLRSIPLALLQRDLRFKRTSAIEAIASLVSAAVVTSLAIAGFRYWSLVLAQVAQVTTSAALVIGSRPTPYSRPRWEPLRRAMRFSKTVVVGNTAWYVYSNADFFVAGRLLGATALGVYSFGWNLVSEALGRISTLVNSVTPAYFSALQKDPANLRRMLLGITEALALVVFPATIGIGLVAPDLVPLVFGAKWVVSVRVIQLLAVYHSMRVLRPVVNNVLMNTGSERFVMWIGVASAVVFPLGFLLASRFGPTGIAAAWMLLYPATAAVVYHRLFTTGVTSGREYVGAVWPAASATVLMAVCVALTRYALADAPAPLRLVVAIAVGVVVYSLTLWVAFRPRLERFVRVVLRTRRATASAAA